MRASRFSRFAALRWKQRAAVWMSGFVHDDGYGVDERVQFGQREPPVLTGRQSCFIVWAIRRALRRADESYPSKAAAIVEWLARRVNITGGDSTIEWWRSAVLCYVLMFVDDVGGASVNDYLYAAIGAQCDLISICVCPFADGYRRGFTIKRSIWRKN